MRDTNQVGLNKYGSWQETFCRYQNYSLFSQLSPTLKPLVSGNLCCHPPKVPGPFHNVIMNAHRTWPVSWTKALSSFDHCFRPWARKSARGPLSLNTLLQVSNYHRSCWWYRWKEGSRTENLGKVLGPRAGLEWEQWEVMP